MKLRGVKQYQRPTSIDEAVTLVQSNVNATYLAGGSWIVAHRDPSLEMVVDLQALGLEFIASDVDEVHVGAMARLQDVIDHPDTSVLAGGLLKRALGYQQSRNLREQGTLGGTLITAGPADPLTTALLVLDAELYYADPVIHHAPFESFVAYRDRLVATRALLLELHLVRPPVRSGTAFEVVGRSPKDKPIVCAAAYIALDEGLPVTVRLAVGGADATPTRLHKVEHMLEGQELTEERVVHVLDQIGPDLQPVADFRGSVEYRLAMAKVLGRRALMSAWAAAHQATA